MDTKICKRCKIELNIDEFGENKRKKDKKSIYCKKCNRELYDKSVEKNKVNHINKRIEKYTLLEDIQEALLVNKFKEISGNENYYINSKGVVYKIFNYKEGNSRLSLVPTSKDGRGIRIQFTLPGLMKVSRRPHLLVYETFNKKLEESDKVYFLDGNKEHYNIENLISGNDLLEFYRKMTNTKEV